MPLYANYGYHPASYTTLPEINILFASSVAHEHRMKVVLENCKKELDKFNKQKKKYASQSCIKPLCFDVGNLVMLNGKSINICCPARKLEQTIY
jgi:hypothetical protein